MALLPSSRSSWTEVGWTRGPPLGTPHRRARTQQPTVEIDVEHLAQRLRAGGFQLGVLAADAGAVHEMRDRTERLGGLVEYPLDVLLDRNQVDFAGLVWRGAVAAAELYKKLNRDYAPPGTVGFNWNEAQTSFSQGKIGMWIDGIGFAENLPKAAPPIRAGPPVEVFAQRAAAHGARVGSEQSLRPKMPDWQNKTGLRCSAKHWLPSR